MSRSVAILAFDQMEALDFAGPFEVLTTANRVALRRGGEQPFEVMSVADTSRITARAGLSILVDRQLREVHEADVVLVPGGVTGDVESNERVVSWLGSVATKAELVASVCTGVFVLAVAGIVTTE